MSESNEPRELNPYTKDYQRSGFDLGPHVMPADAPVIDDEPAPKDSSVVVSADSSESPDGNTPPQEPPASETPDQQPPAVTHPSQLPPSEPIVSAEKDNGLPKVPAVLKHPSLPETKTG